MDKTHDSRIKLPTNRDRTISVGKIFSMVNKFTHFIRFAHPTKLNLFAQQTRSHYFGGQNFLYGQQIHSFYPFAHPTITPNVIAPFVLESNEETGFLREMSVSPPKST